jgi:hypothetical protein
MPIHPRYFGRELKCTSCRTEFVATPPVDSTTPGPPAEFEVARATGESPSVSGDKHRWRWVIGAIVVVVAIAVPLWWLGEDRRQGPGSELFTVDKARTELGSLRCEGRETVTVSLDRETVRELIAALEADDKVAVQALRSSSRCTEVPAGTRVRVLERRKRAVEARVRIIEGPWASRIVWVPIDWVR